MPLCSDLIDHLKGGCGPSTHHGGPLSAGNLYTFVAHRCARVCGIERERDLIVVTTAALSMALKFERLNACSLPKLCPLSISYFAVKHHHTH
jgi:hypothetical protein